MTQQPDFSIRDFSIGDLPARNLSAPAEISSQTKARLEVMDHLLSPFHLEAGPLIDLHRKMMQKDPDFYGRLAVWNHERRQARVESFVATLLTSSSTGHREAGYVLLQDLEPAQVSRIVKILKRHVGKTPRSARGAVVTYLRRLEADRARFDRAVVSARRSLKHLYASLHVKPAERADRILFKGERLELAPSDPKPTAIPTAPRRLPEEPTIRRPTALLVDKSDGMEPALRLGEQLAVLLSDHAAAALHVYAFDLVPYLMAPNPGDFDPWRRTFRHVQAAGSMSAGSVLEAMRRKKQVVEQLVVVTGKDENARPSFTTAYADYVEQLRARPHVCVVQASAGAEAFVDRLHAASIACEAVEVEANTLDDLLPRLSRPSRHDLLGEILAVPLPTRRAA